MATYRVLILGPYRHILEAKDIECESDEEAISQARQLIDGHDIELWNHGRFLVWFPRRKEAARSGCPSSNSL